jgi:hypothetical protein
VDVFDARKDTPSFVDVLPHLPILPLLCLSDCIDVVEDLIVRLSSHTSTSSPTDFYLIFPSHLTIEVYKVIIIRFLAVVVAVAVVAVAVVDDVSTVSGVVIRIGIIMISISIREVDVLLDNIDIGMERCVAWKECISTSSIPITGASSL